MKLALLAAVLGLAAATAEAGQTARRNATPTPSDGIAEAYSLFLLAHRLEDDGDVDGAIAAYRRAMTLDPESADIGAELADLYMRQNRQNEAVTAADEALKLDGANRDAHRVLGMIYASMAADGSDNPRVAREAQRTNMPRAITHLERAVDGLGTQADANLRAMLARLYIGTSTFDKAIPMLVELVKEEPGWRDGPTLLVEAYALANRSAEAVTFLEEAVLDTPQLYPTLADFYGRERRWADSAKAYDQALKSSPRSFDLRVRYGSSLLNSGSRDDSVKARDILREAIAMRATDERALYLLAQAERRTGDLDAAESTSRKLVAQNSKSARGYTALAEVLEERRKYQGVIDVLAPAMATFRSGADSELPLSLLLPHLGFAYQQVGRIKDAVTTFEEARAVSPQDPAVASYLAQAHLVAKNYTAAATVARAARAEHPEDLRLARLEARALSEGGKPDAGAELLEGVVRTQSDNPDAYIALAHLYADSKRGAQAVKVLQDAQGKFPSETTIPFELGAVLDKLNKGADAEAVFRDLIAKAPEHAGALNYLGYMLAERGERLDESVGFLKRALLLEPDNGSYLDSLGWAYFKDGKLDLALENLKRAADQLPSNSVVQDHFGDVLFKLGRFGDAIGAWDRALAGDGDTVKRDEIGKKIRSARQKLPK